MSVLISSYHKDPFFFFYGVTDLFWKVYGYVITGTYKNGERTDIQANLQIEEYEREPGPRIVAPNSERRRGKHAMENLKKVKWEETDFSGPSSTSGPTLFIWFL